MIDTTNESPNLSLGLEQTTIDKKTIEPTNIQTPTITPNISNTSSIIDPSQTLTANVQQSMAVIPTMIEQPSNHLHTNNQQQQSTILEEDVTFSPGEFLIHKSTFSGDFENYDIWCVLDEAYLQKYEPVLLASGERCHQSADVVSLLLFQQQKIG